MSAATCLSQPGERTVFNSKVRGEATVSVSYHSPVDGTLHTSCYTVSGLEGAFRTLRVADVVDIYMHEQEPDRIKPFWNLGMRPGEPGCPALHPS